MTKLILIIVAMGIVTYIPRMLPMVVLNDLTFPPFVKTFFQFIPYAAISALIFPGILTSTDSLYSAMLGGVVSVALAFFRFNVIIVITGAIISVYCYQMFF